MGVRFSKRFKLPGGFRLNVSKSGLGVSWGVRGFRVGAGPGGAHYTASLPGTGVSYTGTLGSLAPATTGDDVAAYEARVAALVSLHRAVPTAWDWDAVLASPAPAGPAEEVARWQWLRTVAAGVLAGSLPACDAVLQYVGPYARIHELGSLVRVSITEAWCVEGWILSHDASVIPGEIVTRTAKGSVSRRKMPASRFFEFYQDHVCSVALRMARETFALLPVPVVFVHVANARTDPATGRDAFVPVLSVAFDRATFATLNFDRVDPSRAVEGFDHAMAFRKTTGLAEITPLDPAQYAVENAP